MQNPTYELTTEFFNHCRIITMTQPKVTQRFKRHLYMLLYKSSICILPNVKLKNLISKTEAAPKEHHD